jgi:hypothetical protein
MKIGEVTTVGLLALDVMVTLSAPPFWVAENAKGGAPVVGEKVGVLQGGCEYVAVTSGLGS